MASRILLKWTNGAGSKDSSGNLINGGYVPCGLFQVTPDWELTCDSDKAQSPHPGGINVCLGDGSVRFLNGSVSATTWANLCDPRDGNPLGSDW